MNVNDKKNALRTRLGMKAFYAILRTLDVIIQKGEGCEEAVRIAPEFF